MKKDCDEWQNTNKFATTDQKAQPGNFGDAGYAEEDYNDGDRLAIFDGDSKSNNN